MMKTIKRVLVRIAPKQINPTWSEITYQYPHLDRPESHEQRVARLSRETRAQVEHEQQLKRSAQALRAMIQAGREQAAQSPRLRRVV